MMTRYGDIEIANNQTFSQHPAGFGISPYLQEKIIFLGQSLPYQQASVMADKLIGLTVSVSQIYRLTNHYGQAIEAELDKAVPSNTDTTDVIYVQADGAMVLTDDGYKENKLARIFSATDIEPSSVAARGGQIDSSQYVAHLGCAVEFIPKLLTHLDEFKGRGDKLVFLSDGAVWLGQMMNKHHPDATQILDIYHVMSYIGEVAEAHFADKKARNLWTDRQNKLLINSELDAVLAAIRELSIVFSLRDRVCAYLESNRYRMDYKRYRDRGLLIGSGAIEAAHRTVVQVRLKRSGQRWSIPGAQRVLNLRVCWMSGHWDLIRQKIEPTNYAMGA
jgi:hypothetical protein